MNFKAMRDSIGIKTGNIYCGSIVLDHQTNEATAEVKIVVFNDNGHWYVYHAALFEPA